MNFLKKTILIILLFAGCNVYGQSNKDKALEKGKEGIKLEDEGKYDEAIKLFEEAEKLDPDKINYPYEIAYSYYFKKEYKQAIKILEKLVNRQDAGERTWELLGNSYDDNGNSEKAIETYKEGLKKLPNSGVLYLELGVMKVPQKEYEKALGYFEKGIQVAPDFPSNYYWAAKIYCNSDERVWGMIYGEIFINLERNSKRTAEISKLLFDTYKEAVTFEPGSKVSCSFSKMNMVNADKLKDTANGKSILPYGVGVYEPCFGVALLAETKIDLNSLDRIRTRFIHFYYQKGFGKSYPVQVFAFQSTLEEKGFLEAYNHWILMKGDEDAFGEWQKNNQEKWDNFLKWFKENPLVVSKENEFYRAQFE